MTLKEMWTRLYRDTAPGIDFDEFEELMSDWTWNELERQRDTLNRKPPSPMTELPTEGF